MSFKLCACEHLLYEDGGGVPRRACGSPSCSSDRAACWPACKLTYSSPISNPSNSPNPTCKPTRHTQGGSS